MRPYRTVLCIVLGLSFASGAFAQLLPSALRQQSAFSPADMQLISNYVKGQVDKMSAGDATGIKDARGTLEAAANGSQAYQDVYAKEINDQLLPLVKGDNWRLKLNAGVVAGRVSDKVNSPRMHDLAVALMSDKNDAIVLWGAKTARSVIPAMYAATGSATSPDLVQAVANAAMTHETGAIAAEAYQALAPKANVATNVSALVKASLPELLKLISARNKFYETGSPDDPAAENFALLFLSYSQVWNVLAPSEKADVMQQISDLLGMAGQRVLTAPRAESARIIPMIAQAGKALTVIAAYPDVNSSALAAASQALSRTDQGNAATLLQTNTAAIYNALTKVAMFSGLKPAPTVKPSEIVIAPVATTKPAIKPTLTPAPTAPAR